MKCPKCGEKLRPIDKFCPNCGEDVKKEVEFQINNAGKQAPIIKKEYVLPTSFSNIYSSSENNILDEYIKIELENQKINLNTKLVPLYIRLVAKLIWLFNHYRIFVIINIEVVW